jgi:hypothetical protein
MKISSKDFRAAAGKKVDLDKRPTIVKPVYKSKKEYKKLLQEQVEEAKVATSPVEVRA